MSQMSQMVPCAPKDLLHVSQVAAILGVTRNTVYRYVERGVLLPYNKIPPFRFYREEILKLLNLPSP